MKNKDKTIFNFILKEIGLEISPLLEKYNIMVYFPGEYVQDVMIHGENVMDFEGGHL